MVVPTVVPIVRGVWNKNVCLPWLVIIIILYSVPFIMDLMPDKDVYLAGIPFLGLWGTVLLTVLGLIASIGYGMSCVHTHTVYRCGVFGCDDDDEHLVFPPGFPEEEKIRYRAAMKGVPRGFTTWHPFSEYNKRLAKLNESLYNPSFNTPPMSDEYYKKVAELTALKNQRLARYGTGGDLVTGI